MESLIYGSGGAVAIVTAVMGVVKGIWKPEVKQLLMIPTVLLSGGASAVVLMTSEYGLSLVPWLIITALVAGGELVAQNEAWPVIKKALTELLSGMKI